MLFTSYLYMYYSCDDLFGYSNCTIVFMLPCVNINVYMIEYGVQILKHTTNNLSK